MRRPIQRMTKQRQFDNLANRDHEKVAAQQLDNRIAVRYDVRAFLDRLFNTVDRYGMDIRRSKLGALLLSLCALTASACSGGSNTLPLTRQHADPSVASRATKSYSCPVYVTGDGTVVSGSCSGDGGGGDGGSDYPCVPGDLICVGTGGGGGGGVRPQPSPKYGTQGSCPNGFIAFSSGCEDEGPDIDQLAGFPNPIRFFEPSYVLNVKVWHYWDRHLACYLVHSTKEQFASALSLNFYSAVYLFNSDPPVGFDREYTFNYNDNGTNWPVHYRIFHVSPGPPLDRYDNNTAFIVGKPDC